MEWAIPSFVAASRSIVWLLARRSRVRSIVDQIACPVLVIQGEQDVIVPPQAARWLQERRPDFVFEFFPDAGHVPQMETPAEFVAAVERFLSRISVPAGSEP
jgi:pimeloyl-ACP methyl ester carboxylesterase